MTGRSRSRRTASACGFPWLRGTRLPWSERRLPVAFALALEALVFGLGASVPTLRRLVAGDLHDDVPVAEFIAVQLLNRLLCFSLFGEFLPVRLCPNVKSMFEVKCIQQIHSLSSR